MTMITSTEEKTSAPTFSPSFTTVLDFWFNEKFDYDINHNYKTKWFPLSKQLQEAADASVKESFSTLLTKAEEYVAVASSSASANHWVNGWETTSPLSLLALIIVFDQFTRHIYRDTSIEAKQKQKDLNDKYALFLSEKMLDKGWHKMLNAEQCIFAMMPLRHNASRYVQ